MEMIEALLHPVNIYCERGDAGLLAEPLNALTNLAFIAAAWLLWHNRGKSDVPGATLLIALVGIIGIGSGLFHTFANRLTGLMDVLPIAAFLLSYLWLYSRRFLAFSRAGAVFALIAFIALVVLTGFAPPGLRVYGVNMYMAALAVMALFYLQAMRAEKPYAKALGAGAALFGLSLALRTLDQPLCGAWPYGTHMFWHVLNAAVLYLYVKLYIEHGGAGINSK